MDKGNPIEKQICSAIHSIAINSLQGDGAWTKAIFKALADLGVSLGYKICSSCSDGEFDGGWLYDLIWYETNDAGQLTSVPLILESEWNRAYSQIKYDFEKLLVGRAKYKVMVFQASGNKVREYLSNLQAAICAFEDGHPAGTYLLVCFDEKRWTFEIEAIRGGSTTLSTSSAPQPATSSLPNT